MRLQQCGLFQLFERGRRATCQFRGEMIPLKQHLDIGNLNRRNVRRFNLDLGPIEPIAASPRLVRDCPQVRPDSGARAGVRSEPRQLGMVPIVACQFPPERWMWRDT